MVDSIRDTQYLMCTGNASAANYLSSSYNPYSSSIFGSYAGYGYGYGFGCNPSQYTAYNTQMAESNLTITQKNTATNSLYNAPQQAVESRMGTLQRQILKDNQTNIKEEYAKLYEEVKTMYADAGYTDVSEAQIKAYIENVYAQKTGSRLVDDIEKHGTNPFLHGMVQGTGIGYLIGDKTSAEENISYITGEAVEDKTKAATWAGRVVGAVATVAAAPFVIKYGSKLLGAIGKGYKALLGLGA